MTQLNYSVFGKHVHALINDKNKRRKNGIDILAAEAGCTASYLYRVFVTGRPSILCIASLAKALASQGYVACAKTEAQHLLSLVQSQKNCEQASILMDLLHPPA